MQRNFEAQQLAGVRRAEIDRSLGALGNRIHADAAAHGSQVEGGARLLGQRRFRQSGQRPGQRGDRVRRARVGKTVPPRPCNCHPIAPAAQRLRHG